MDKWRDRRDRLMSRWMEGRGIGEHVIMCNDTVCSCLTQPKRNIPLLTLSKWLPIHFMSATSQ